MKVRETIINTDIHNKMITLNIIKSSYECTYETLDDNYRYPRIYFDCPVALYE